MRGGSDVFAIIEQAETKAKPVAAQHDLRGGARLRARDKLAARLAAGVDVAHEHAEPQVSRSSSATFSDSCVFWRIRRLAWLVLRFCVNPSVAFLRFLAGFAFKVVSYT